MTHQRSESALSYAARRFRVRATALDQGVHSNSGSTWTKEAPHQLAIFSCGLLVLGSPKALSTTSRPLRPLSPTLCHTMPHLPPLPPTTTTTTHYNLPHSATPLPPTSSPRAPHHRRDIALPAWGANRGMNGWDASWVHILRDPVQGLVQI